jgi:hypothetical protein
VNQDGLVVPEVQEPLTTMEVVDDDLEEILHHPPKQPAAIFPLLDLETHPTLIEQCCKYIERRREPLEKPFADVSEVLLHSLEDAEKTRGGPKGILTKVTRLAHGAFAQQVSDGFDTD